jgi:hypothetical protein
MKIIWIVIAFLLYYYSDYLFYTEVPKKRKKTILPKPIKPSTPQILPDFLKGHPTCFLKGHPVPFDETLDETLDDTVVGKKYKEPMEGFSYNFNNKKEPMKGFSYNFNNKKEPMEGFSYNFNGKKETTKTYSLITPTLSFQVYTFPKAITVELCKKLCTEALPQLHESTVYSEKNVVAELAKERISMTATLINQDTLLLRNMASQLTGMPLSHIENVQVTRYKKDGKFDYHYDTDPKQKNQASWSRIATLMFYLNEDFVGGQTEFPKIQTSFIPETGKALLFWSVLDGELIKDSMHKGCEIISGEKWIANIWVHSVPFYNR